MKTLAKAIQRAALLREQSFDKKKEKYGLSLQEACNQAGKEAGYDNRGTQHIYMLLKNSWNESLDWAKEYSY